MSQKIRMSIAVMFIAVAPQALAAEADSLAAARSCATQSDDKARLACYDAILRPVPSAAVVPGVAASKAPEDAFGYRGDVAREELDRKKSAEPPKLERLDAKVTEVSTKPLGEFIVTLDNGQVWAQKSPDKKVRLAVGDAITIKAGTLGSFMLVTESGRSTRVARVQ